jgi:S-adenosyl methyltransferase
VVYVQRVYNERVATPQTLRTREQVARFFTGLDLVEPGLVQVHQWRPDPDDFARSASSRRTARWGASLAHSYASGRM